jgi:predicted RND superfamily exporter protein
MSDEMQGSFSGELWTITLLTAAAIFLIVLISSRSFIVPAILVLIVQCGVYITVTVIGWQGYQIYFLALLMVECILMGATIDYGILYTNYYRESRASLASPDALKAAYDGSVHSIMTSGLIIVLITGIFGYTYPDPTIAEICRTIAIGALSAILVILFFLPGLLATLDRLVVRKKKR